MDLQTFLDLDPNNEYEIIYKGAFVWKHTHFQYKSNNNDKLDPNTLPLLDEKYIVGESGEPLLNDNDEVVFDPTQNIEEQRYLEIEFKQIYKSKTFVSLLQSKIKELIDLGELNPYDHTYINEEGDEAVSKEFDYDEFNDCMNARPGWSFLDELFYTIGCDDKELILEKEDDNLLWYTSTELDEEIGDWHVSVSGTSKVTEEIVTEEVPVAIKDVVTEQKTESNELKETTNKKTSTKKNNKVENSKSLGIDENESIESMVNKLDMLDGIAEKASFCLTIYLHLTMKHGKTSDFSIWSARKSIEEGEKILIPIDPNQLPKSDNQLMQILQEQEYDMGLFMDFLYKKDKKVFNLFTEPIYQRIEKDEKQEKMGLWVFVLVIIILIIIFW